MSNTKFPAYLPAAGEPAWLGVMGGGQLGRMFAHAAQAMGYRVAVLEPSTDCPAGQVAERLVEAGYEDAAGLDALAAQCVAVTTEFENVPAASLSRLAQQVFRQLQRCELRVGRSLCFSRCHGSFYISI